MQFLNREKEKERLIKALSSKSAKFIVIYGRRRCGKSTLIKNVLKRADIYFMAHLSDEAIQRMQFAKTIAEHIKGFDSVLYPDWESLFNSLNKSVKGFITLCIDEFPYLVKISNELPSILQKIIDNHKNRKYHLILCGSSQQMMQSMFLSSTAPLYGRADEIIKIEPLKAGYICEAIKCNSVEAIAEYSVWGGVPRYWELRKENETFEKAIKYLILDKSGVLHDEPYRLFLDEMRESVQATSLLSVVGLGSSRLSEIASRIEKSATQLNRPINNLVQLGYLTREVPFGEHKKNSKKGIYRISDPFMNFYFSFVIPNLSRLELGLTDIVYENIKSRLNIFISREWENLCRRSIPALPIEGIYFDIAYRWWGLNIKGKPMEIDIVAESADKNYLLIGECKWSDEPDEHLLYKIKEKISLFPYCSNYKKIIPTVFIKNKTQNLDKITIFTPEDILGRLK